MECVGVLFVCLLGGALEPADGFAGVGLFSQGTVKEDHAEFEHAWGIPEGSGLAVKGGGPRGLLFSAGANLVADCNAVRGGCVVLLCGLEVEMVRTLVVDLEAECTGAVAVGKEELGLVICVTLGGETSDYLEGFGKESLTKLFGTAGVLDVRPDVLCGIDEILCVEEMSFGIRISLDTLPVLIDVLFCVRRGLEVDCFAFDG